MTKARLAIWSVGAASFYVGYAWWLWWLGHAGTTNTTYSFWKDAIPLAVAVPAVLLGYCFTRRANLQKQLFEIWIRLVAAVEEAIKYTHYPTTEPPPNYMAYAETLKGLSCMVEELRGVFKNVGNYGGTGLFPFEAIKMILDETCALKWGTNYDYVMARAARGRIVIYWKETRKQFLKELDIVRPVHRNTARERGEEERKVTPLEQMSKEKRGHAEMSEYVLQHIHSNASDRKGGAGNPK